MNRKLRLVNLGFVIAAAALATIASGALADDRDGEFNERGNYLIADQFNNRVIEVEHNGKIVWHFGKGPADFSKMSVIGVNDAQRVGELTLMAGTGTPPNQPEAPNCKKATGCPDNRVLLVDRHGHIVWQYGQFGVTGAGLDQLNTPVQNTWVPVDEQNNEDSEGKVPQGHVLITDQGNSRIIEVRVPDKHIVWEYDGLNNPNCAELLKNGHILICDENNNQALEVTHTKPSTIVHAYIMAGGVLFSGVAFASRLPNGHTLITDSGNARIVETDEKGMVFWQYFTNTDPESNPRCISGICSGPSPTRALRLHNGNTLISDQYNHRVIEVSPNLQIVRTFGDLASLGYNTKSVKDGGLNSPYDAKRIGDYTGITPPFEHDSE
ncbi:MAG TPA: hypothetical protein VN982_04615 [Candidatus Dormibacteraeota bacterium]|nr:hypothetical protein [Candidatus Dormibacteraeota bacterium]